MVMGLVGCGNNSTSGINPTTSQESSKTARGIIEASIANPVLELGERTRVVTDVEGVSYRSGDEEIATVDASGHKVHHRLSERG